MIRVTASDHKAPCYEPFVLYCGDRAFLRAAGIGAFVEIEPPQSAFYKSAMARPDQLDSSTLEELQWLGIDFTGRDADTHVDDTLLETIRSTTAFVDYSTPEAFCDDRENMISVVQSDGRPQLVSDRDDACRALSEQHAEGRIKFLMELIRTVFVVRGSARFHNHQVFRKAIPSMGGRHGVEVYLSIGENDGGKAAVPGCYHFSPTEDRFRGPLERLTCRAGTGILLSAVFERYQWRYRSGWVYQCILLDIGHAVGALRTLAAAEGYRLQVREPIDVDLSIGDALDEDVFLLMTLAE
jgi:hypothetical protein